MYVEPSPSVRFYLERFDTENAPEPPGVGVGLGRGVYEVDRFIQDPKLIMHEIENYWHIKPSLSNKEQGMTRKTRLEYFFGVYCTAVYRHVFLEYLFTGRVPDLRPEHLRVDFTRMPDRAPVVGSVHTGTKRIGSLKDVEEIKQMVFDDHLRPLAQQLIKMGMPDRAEQATYATLFGGLASRIATATNDPGKTANEILKLATYMGVNVTDYVRFAYGQPGLPHQRVDARDCCGRFRLERKQTVQEAERERANATDATQQTVPKREKCGNCPRVLPEDADAGWTKFYERCAKAGSVGIVELAPPQLEDSSPDLTFSVLVTP